MNATAKALALLTLLAGIVLSVRVLALGHETAWLPFLSEPAARLLLRSLTIGMGLAGWFLSQSLISARGLGHGAIGDAGHEWTTPVRDWLARRPRAADALLIATSAFIDLFGLFLLGSALFGPSLRPGIALLILFVFRQVSQLTCALPTPPGMIWRHPGVPSLLVTYHVANDFFFSGHTAIATLGAIEMTRAAPPWLAATAIGIAALEAVTVITLRAHYTMDVLAAVFAAFTAAGLAAALTVGF